MRIRTLAAVPAAVLLAAALGAPAATAAPAHRGTGCTSWQIMTTPAVPGVGTPAESGQAELSSVSAVSPSDTWFTGTVYPYTTPYPYGGPEQAWALQWDGRGLTQPAQPTLLPAANPLPNAKLLGSFDSTSDGWQVFTEGSGNPPADDDDTTLAEHWHDGQWILTPMAVSPDPASKGIRLSAVAALSPDDAWASGTLYAIGPGNLFGATPVGALIEHWDGTGWSIVPNPAQDRPGVSLSALAVVSPSDIWAAGYQTGASGQTSPLVEHWNGSSWTAVPAPAGQGSSVLMAVSADGPDDAWATGIQNTDGYAYGPPLVEHWSGSTWAVVSLPPTVRSAYNQGALDAVYAASPSDVWAGATGFEGGTLAGDGDLLHWDGSNWTLVPTGPQEYGLVYGFRALGGTGPGNVWAAGYVYPGDFDATSWPLAAHLSCRTGGR
jgi:hypothetical protein